MLRRALSCAALSTLAGVVLLVPLSATAASAQASGPYPGSVFKGSVGKRVPSASGPVAAPRRAPTPPAAAPKPSGQVFQDEVLNLTNRERTSRRLQPLTASGCADGFADSWAGVLARQGLLSHQPLAPILTACQARGAGENVAFGNVTPEEMVAMWMASPGHRANILNPSYTGLGVGSQRLAGGRVYGVQVFLAR